MPKMSAAMANAMANVFESTIGTGGTLEFRSGAEPASAAAADSGTLLSTIALPADFMSAASGGVASLLGT